MRGRGHTRKSEEQPQRIKTTKIGEEHGTPIIRLPRAFVKLGIKLNQEVTMSCEGNNPLNWEIKIKPTTQPVRREILELSSAN